MIIAGIICIIAGIILLIYGNSLNNDLSAQLMSVLQSGKGNPGTIWIIFGVAVAIVGVGLLLIGLKKKNSNSNNNSNE